MKHFFNPNNIIFVQPSIIHPERKESIDRKVFQRRKKKKKTEEWKVAVGSMESWISIRVEFQKATWTFIGFFEAWILGNFRPTRAEAPSRRGCSPMGGTLGSIFLVGSLSMGGPPPPFAIPFIFLRRPTNSRANCDSFFFPPPTFLNANPPRD